MTFYIKHIGENT